GSLFCCTRAKESTSRLAEVHAFVSTLTRLEDNYIVDSSVVNVRAVTDDLIKLLDVHPLRSRKKLPVSDDDILRPVRGIVTWPIGRSELSRVIGKRENRRALVTVACYAVPSLAGRNRSEVIRVLLIMLVRINLPIEHLVIEL